MKYFLPIILFFTGGLTTIYGQDTNQEETFLQKAHKKEIDLEKFSQTENNHFKLNIFAVNQAIVNKTHHWFIQLLTPENDYINYADVKLKGYLKENPTIPFLFMNPVSQLCSNGKYIIGFTKVKHAGVYVLDISIDNFGIVDNITIEINILEKSILENDL